MKRKEGHRRGRVMEMCFKTIKLLIRKPITSEELAKELGVSRQTSRRYIHTASLFFPVAEITRQCGIIPPTYMIKDFSLINIEKTENAKKNIDKTKNKIMVDIKHQLERLKETMDNIL